MDDTAQCVSPFFRNRQRDCVKRRIIKQKGRCRKATARKTL